jgi:hypothetical protein
MPKSWQPNGTWLTWKSESCGKWRNETRLGIAKVYERVAESKSEFIKWNLGALIAVAGMFLAFSKLPV